LDLSLRRDIRINTNRDTLKNMERFNFIEKKSVKYIYSAQ
jgi:hypothetical protein